MQERDGTTVLDGRGLRERAVREWVVQLSAKGRAF